MRNLPKNTLLLCVSSLASVFVAELTIRLAVPQNLSGSLWEQTELGLSVNKSAGRARHQLGERVVYYQFTAPHLRAPVLNASIKVLALGDSFSFGWLLDQRDTYVGLLQRKIDEAFGSGVFSLLNAAVGGWGTGDYVAFVEDFGDEIDPDIILVFLNTDDVGRAFRSPLWEYSNSDATLTRVAAPRSKLKAFMNAIPGYEWLLEHSHLMQLFRTAATSRNIERQVGPLPVSHGPSSDPHPESSQRAIELGAALFKRLRTWSEERNTSLLISTTGWHNPPYVGSTEPTRAFMSHAESIFSDLDIPYSDPSDIVWQKRSADHSIYVFQNDRHPNEAGAALIAEHVFPFLETELTRFCRQTSRCTGYDNAPE